MPAVSWQKSSFSAANGNGECLEVSATPNTIALRESDAPRTVLALSRPALRAFLGYARGAEPGVHR
ncbi:DUF397 domain-containing protein [Streptomyces orinoci]|uniref:DUF397 domain-containing protein n=1 Tax=Streptomyces orinoci TaxID=67339 RepID=A0ABV3JU30_STRON|nr:DUF397 domain-containing protein [Streptomyces orinoci]